MRILTFTYGSPKRQLQSCEDHATWTRALFGRLCLTSFECDLHLASILGMALDVFLVRILVDRRVMNLERRTGTEPKFLLAPSHKRVALLQFLLSFTTRLLRFLLCRPFHHHVYAFVLIFTTSISAASTSPCCAHSCCSHTWQ